MDHLLCIFEGDIFRHPIHMYYVWYQAVQQDFFSSGEISALFAKIFFKFQLWYWIHIYTTKYSILI